MHAWQTVVTNRDAERWQNSLTPDALAVSRLLAAHAGLEAVAETRAFVLAICPAASTKSTFPYICIANKGKCFCLAHYEVPIAKDTVNSQ